MYGQVFFVDTACSVGIYQGSSAVVKQIRLITSFYWLVLHSGFYALQWMEANRQEVH